MGRLRGSSLAGAPLRVAVAALTGAALLPALADAHLERPSYWPDPAVDTSVKGGAGGEVPEARSLKSAVTEKGPGDTHVACKGRKGRTSLKLLRRSVRKAVRDGYVLRPSQPRIEVTRKQARRLLRMNARFAKMCRFHSVQDAVDAAGNNDRVVVMPGRYTEPDSRNSPVNDPRCNPSMLQQDQRGALTPSYEYQASCPNDQNLIYIQGRAIKGEPLMTPAPDRHGIPAQELGECVRCNLQFEGSGVKPEDVILDAGKNYIDPKDPEARPGGDIDASQCHISENGADNPCFAKHVVLRTDRTDGFVGRNFVVRGAKEHGFYTEETDGILLDRVKFFWNADYGHLSFTTDHNVVQNCEGFGSGDAVVYPGAAPQTGQYRDESFYPEERYNTVIRNCDLHGSSMGYSGSMGNSVRVTNNHFYGNANGLTTDTLSAPGHPGYPADGMKIDHNWFYANNLDVYNADPAFEALVPQPVGTGFFWAGHNNGRFEDNWVFDNWRQGTMLISVPDAIAGEAEGALDPKIHCPTASPIPEASVSTSCDNHYSGNHMGQVPPGFKPFPALTKFGNQTTLTGGGTTAPNGVDFWWDEMTANTGNCWFGNVGSDGTAASVTGDPSALPSDCGTSIGSPAYAGKAPILLACYGQWETEQLDTGACSWFDTPPRPGSAAALSAERSIRRAERDAAATSDGQTLQDWAEELAGEISLGPTH